MTTEAFFIIMEYCEQGDLTDFYGKIRNKPDKIKSVFKGVAEGVRFLHDVCNFAHLDLKP